jgi:small subunit ribosomal protein S6
MSQNMKQYEAMFLLGPIATAEPETAMNLCKKTIESHGGQIMVIKKWDERKLAYEIGGHKRGTYIIAFFKATGDAIAPIERDVKLSEEILRVLIMDASHLNEREMAAVEPQPIIREERPPMDMGGIPSFDRGDRSDRPFRPRRREEVPGEFKD